MEHQEIRERLLAFRDMELPEGERRDIAFHLETCAECRGVFSRWERAGSALRRTPLPAASEEFVSRVLGRIEAMEEPAEEPVTAGWQLPRWIVMGLGYAFGVFLMFIAIANRQPVLNADSVLLSEMPQHTQWAAAYENPDAGQMFGMSKEEV